MSKKAVIISLVLCAAAVWLSAVEPYADASVIREAGPPKFTKEGIIFTLPKGYGSDVFLRTSIDNWQTDHYFRSNLYDVLYTVVPYRLNVNEVRYRINVDGFWETDPYNTLDVPDMLGSRISTITVPEEIKYYQAMPVIEDTGEKVKKVSFRLYSPAASEVNFVCSVDNWCQYSYPMSMNADGYWEISKNFAKGVYSYYFLVDGKKTVDINNPGRVIDRIKGEVSCFEVK